MPSPRLFFLTLLLAASTLQAQPAETFGTSERITAVDLVVELDVGGLRSWASGKPIPGGLEPGDFELLYDAEPRPVIAVEPLGPRPKEPWTIVLYFDQSFSNSAHLRHAASALGEQIETLAALGEVTIVAADPRPRTLLSPTRDTGEIHRVLAQLALEATGADEILALRRDCLIELQRAEPALPPGEIAAGCAATEAHRVEEVHDALLGYLIGLPDVGQPRALVLASGGYDLDPAAFYAASLDPEAPPPPALDTATQELAEVLAAYGWVVVAMAEPEPRPIKPGVRVGKWRISRLGATFEEAREPEKAEAYLELGEALLGQAKLEDAADAFKKAVYHFYDAPKTAPRQARACALLGATLERLGKRELAQTAFEEALLLDPSLAERPDTAWAVLRQPLAPLTTLARGTAGRTARNPRELGAAFESLARRVRLTYQVSGWPDGELHGIEVRSRKSFHLNAPDRARSASPKRVTELRMRQLMRGETQEGELAIEIELVPETARGETGKVRVRRTGAVSETETESVLRITVGSADTDDQATIESVRLEPQRLGADWSWMSSRVFELSEKRPWLGVLVEDLATGRWGAKTIEAPDKAPIDPEGQRQ